MRIDNTSFQNQTVWEGEYQEREAKQGFLITFFGGPWTADSRIHRHTLRGQINTISLNLNLTKGKTWKGWQVNLVHGPLFENHWGKIHTRPQFSSVRHLKKGIPGIRYLDITPRIWLHMYLASGKLRPGSVEMKYKTCPLTLMQHILPLLTSLADALTTHKATSKLGKRGQNVFK